MNPMCVCLCYCYSATVSTFPKKNDNKKVRKVFPHDSCFRFPFVTWTEAHTHTHSTLNKCNLIHSCCGDKLNSWLVLSLVELRKKGCGNTTQKFKIQSSFVICWFLDELNKKCEKSIEFKCLIVINHFYGFNWIKLATLAGLYVRFRFLAISMFRIGYYYEFMCGERQTNFVPNRIACFDPTSICCEQIGI